jgi:hypothetical protein
MSKQTNPLRTEAAMIVALTASVRRLFGRAAGHATEVGAHGRSRTDICVFADGQLIAIEAKLSNRRRAIGQAYFNRYYADQSYIAVLDHHITDELTEAARQWKLGILAVSRKGAFIALPAPTSTPDLDLRARVIGSVFA